MFNDLAYRIRAMTRRKAVEQELDDELRFHIEQQAAKYVSAGTSPDEANRMARLSLHGPEQAKERCRDARGTVLWDTTIQDLRYAIRQLRAAPAFTTVAILILALGIGANTAIFSLLDAVVLRSLPVRDPQRLFVPRWVAKESPSPYSSSSFEPCFEPKTPGSNGGCSFSYPLFKSIQSKNGVFSSVTAFAGPTPLNVQANGPADIISGEVVSGSFFQTLGVGAALGRTLDEHDDTAAAAATAVLSYGYWQSAFGGDPSAIGKTIRLNALPFTIVGVAAAGFNHLSPGRLCQLWIPIHAATSLGIPWASNTLNDGHSFWLQIVGRAEPGMTLPRAEAALTALLKNEMVHSNVLKPSSNPAVEIASANRALGGIRNMLARPLYVLMCAVSLILLIACANVAGLMTARAAARQREIAIRFAVGAGRGRILRQLLTESLVLAALSGLAGMALAWFTTRSLASFLPMHLDVHPNLRILLFTSVISLGSGIFFGIIPALRCARACSPSRINVGAEGLQYGMSLAERRRWFSNSLVVAQVTLATVMLLGAGLFMRTLFNLRTTNPGFNPMNILLFGLDPVSVHYSEPRIQSLYRNLRDRLASLPGVTAVTYSSTVLLSGGLGASDYKIEGRPNRTAAHVNILNVGPDFFQTMGIPRLQGRVLTADEFFDARPVAVVNQAFVRQYLTGRNPLGVRFGQDSAKAIKNEIVGVVADAKYDNLREPIRPTAYMPLRGGFAHFELRTAGKPSVLIPSVQKIVAELDPNLPLFDVKTQTDQIDELLAIERLLARLSGTFGFLALTLACVGLYGLLSYEVTQRTREIGIRMALGAPSAAVCGDILRETLVISLIGVALGIPAAIASTRGLSVMLYGVEANDPTTLLSIASILMIVAGLAGYIPARRASLVDPIVALRYE
jgi:predicted permease